MKVGTDSVILGAWADCNGASRILDVGTGTGILALMIAQRYPGAEITAIEIDRDSFEQARSNFAASPWKDRLMAVQGDFRTYMFDSKFDCIIANPPYFADSLKSRNEQLNIARHDTALDFEALAAGIKKWLKPDGRANIVISADNAGRLEMAFSFEYLFCAQKVYVYTSEKNKPKLVLFKFLTKITPCKTDNFYIRRADRYTDEYKLLTKDFYLNF